MTFCQFHQALSHLISWVLASGATSSDHEGIADERRGFLEPSVPITALAKMNNSDLDEVGAIVLM